MIDRRHFGTMPNGTAVEEITLTNTQGLSLSVIPYGGIVTRLLVPDKKGDQADIVCGFDNLGPYLKGHPYFGCIAGRVAGRISGGRFNLNGKKFRLAVNDPPNHLHGGTVGFDKRLWSIEADDSMIRLTYLSPDGEEGYPGNVRVTVTYRLTDRNQFINEYEAAADAPTPISLTHHGYFNLRGEGQGTIHKHMLQILADHYAASDESMTLLGLREEVNPANDFGKTKPIGEALPGLLKQHGDLYFVPQNIENELPLVAKLYEASSCRAMSVYSSEPCIQFYTGVSLDGTLIGKSGRPYGQHSALCLECEGYPDGPNHPALGDIILNPGQTYRQTTIYAFSIE